MPSPIVTTTLQACALSAASNVIAQYISSSKTSTPFSINWVTLGNFILFTLLSAPANFLWQIYLESTFPSYTLSPSESGIDTASQEPSALDSKPAPSLTTAQLSKQNTVIKTVLDQTLSASVNTLLFSLFFAATKGASTAEAMQIARQEFWGLMMAGWRVWPLVSVLNFAVVRSVEVRSLIGGIVGFGWGVWLGLVSGA